MIESGNVARFNVTAKNADGGTDYVNFPLSAYPPPGRWSHVEVLLEVGPGKPAVTASVTIDHVKALPPTITACSSLMSRVLLYIGLLESSGGTPPTGEARYDNVLFDSNKPD